MFFFWYLFLYLYVVASFVFYVVVSFVFDSTANQAGFFFYMKPVKAYKMLLSYDRGNFMTLK